MRDNILCMLAAVFITERDFWQFRSNFELLLCTVVLAAFFMISLEYYEYFKDYLEERRHRKIEQIRKDKYTQSGRDHIQNTIK